MSNKKNKYDKLNNIVLNSLSYAQCLRKLNIVVAGGNYKTLKAKIKEQNLDISHFTGQCWNKGLKVKSSPSKPLNEILVEYSTYSSTKLKKRLFKKGIKNKICEKCFLKVWSKKPIPLEIHHINGINTDHRLENLQVICPNCHAQTDNYRGKNKLKK